MIDHLQQKVIRAFAATENVILSTCGPAEIQSSQVACLASGMRLFLLVQRASEHLSNLEPTTAVVLVAPGWELRGTAKVVSMSDCLGDSDLPQPADGFVLVEVSPSRLTLSDVNSSARFETIDF